ncbi:monovalent cation:proton antiporter-2 (CPA2) family protein [Pseudochrobactrum algeriensis]|nr:potassium transporter TrkA [Pseudochrobactrum saccharolyticum]MBX8812001.1 potassium transporter TrkA [Ochrobactrum sp. MR34]QVQ38321.1 monovalent cation:proton antiporter-2 (CPA2) family protein [Pseudochrobactrum algeriensis]MDP8251622.1 cation:proton antiporter [Pseudochrobactrum saccharolyticum]QVQ41545.1 monovalent cation:proton antiporter-2 (CPA2) family protein [Pseudochrobactrum algeriensis]
MILGGAIIAAPLFKRMGLGTVLGYLAAGVIIGPIARFITDGEELLHFSELGVVFLLFIIGLDLKPSRLWSLRHAIFGLGLAQVALCAVTLAFLGVYVAGLPVPAAIIVGCGFALSSTAFAMQILEDKGETSQKYGQKAFAILLFQDLAIVPILALIPALSPSESSQSAANFHVAAALGAIIILIIAGRYLLNPMFRIIGNTGAREVMIAAALFVVLGSAALMEAAGLSMAMGAFIAGVLLADSSYRHELAADVEPFRGIFLGLFFVAVGLSLNLVVILDNWLMILLSVPVIIVTKIAIIYLLCRIFRTSHNDAVKVAFLLPQGGEFAFVLFSTASAAAVITDALASELIAAITISMALTPLCVTIGNRLLTNTKQEDGMEENFEGAGSDVLMIGFSRYGQIASQILLAGGSDVTVIDNSANKIRAAGRFGFRIYFGDGQRKDVLEMAGIRKAKLVAICTEKKEITDRIVDLIQTEFPDVKLYVRSFDREHTLQLRAKGVDYELRETFESGLLFGRKTLEALGMPEEEAQTIADDVRQRDEDRLHVQASEGILAGRHLLFNKPVTPEPLVKPTRSAVPLDKATEETIAPAKPYPEAGIVLTPASE